MGKTRMSERIKPSKVLIDDLRELLVDLEGLWDHLCGVDEAVADLHDRMEEAINQYEESSLSETVIFRAQDLRIDSDSDVATSGSGHS